MGIISVRYEKTKDGQYKKITVSEEFEYVDIAQIDKKIADSQAEKDAALSAPDEK